MKIKIYILAALFCFFTAIRLAIRLIPTPQVTYTLHVDSAF